MAPALIEASTTGPKNTKTKTWILGINNNLQRQEFSSSSLNFDSAVKNTACVLALSGGANRRTKSHFVEFSDKLCEEKILFDNNSVEDISLSGMEDALDRVKSADMNVKVKDEKNCSVPQDDKPPTTSCGSVSTDIVSISSQNDHQRFEQPIALRDSILLSIHDRKKRTQSSYVDLQQRASKLDSQLRRMHLDFTSSHIENSITLLNDKSCSIVEKEHIDDKHDGNNHIVTSFNQGRQHLLRGHDSNNCTTQPCSSNSTHDQSSEQIQRSCKVLKSHMKVLFRGCDQETTDIESDNEIYDDHTSNQIPTVTSTKSTLAPVCPETTWLMDRAAAGSKCKWLESKIADLDSKIRLYENLSKKVLSKQQKCKFQAFIPTTHDCGIKTVLDTDVDKIIKDLPASSCSISKKSQNNHHVNGIVHSEASSRRTNPTTTLSSPNFMDYETNKSVSCARALKLQQRPKHKYINVSKCAIQNNIDEADHLITLRNCHLCEEGRKSTHSVATGFNNNIDDGFHSRLSWTCDTLLPFHLEKLLRTTEIDCSIKPKSLKHPLKRNLEKKKISPVHIRPSKLNCIQSKSSHGMDRKRLLHSPPLRSPNSNVTSPFYKNNKLKSTSFDASKKKLISVSAAAQLQKRANRLSASFSDNGDIKNPVNLSATPNTPTISSPNAASPSAAISKKKRGSNAFDINNIVIPYSMAAATRVEKLKYKEILTPGFRLMDDDQTPTKKAKRSLSVPTNNDDMQHVSEDEEDISQTAFSIRHAACEVEERRKFSRFFQPVRRLKSQKNSECNTPEPNSPCSDDSPRQSLSGTPTLDNNSNSNSNFTPKPKFSRSSSLFFPTSGLEPVEDTVPPWPKHKFPMNEDDFKALCEDTHLHGTRSQTKHKEIDTNDIIKCEDINMSVDLKKNNSMPSLNGSPIDSPENNLSPIGDEGWTVKLLGNEKIIENDPSHSRKGIVLKLAKK